MEVWGWTLRMLSTGNRQGNAAASKKIGENPCRCCSLILCLSRSPPRGAKVCLELRRKQIAQSCSAQLSAALPAELCRLSKACGAGEDFREQR